MYRRFICIRAILAPSLTVGTAKDSGGVNVNKGQNYKFTEVNDVAI